MTQVQAPLTVRALFDNCRSSVRRNISPEREAYGIGLLEDNHTLNMEKLCAMLYESGQGDLSKRLKTAYGQNSPNENIPALIGVRVENQIHNYAQIERLNIHGERWFTIVLSREALRDFLNENSRYKVIDALEHELGHENFPMVFKPLGENPGFDDYSALRWSNEMSTRNAPGEIVTTSTLDISAHGEGSGYPSLPSSAQFRRDWNVNRAFQAMREPAAIEIDFFPRIQESPKRFLSPAALSTLLDGVDPIDYARSHGRKLVSEQAPNTHPIFCVELPQSTALEKLSGKWVVRWFHDVSEAKLNINSGKSVSSKTPGSNIVRAIASPFIAVARYLARNLFNVSTSSPQPLPVVSTISDEAAALGVSQAKGEIIGRVLARHFFKDDPYHESEVLASTLSSGDVVVMSRYMDGFKELINGRIASFNDEYLAKALLFLSIFNIDGGMSRSFLVNDEGKFTLVDMKNLSWDCDGKSFESAKIPAVQESRMIGGASGIGGADSEQIRLFGREEKMSHLASFMIPQCQEFLERLNEGEFRNQLINEITIEADVDQVKAKALVDKIEANLKSYLKRLQTISPEKPSEFSMHDTATNLSSMLDTVANISYFDEKSALESTGDDAHLLLEVIIAALQENAELLDGIRQAFEQRDCENLQRKAHTLKSNASILSGQGSLPFLLAQELETFALKGNIADAARTFARLEPAVRKLNAELSAHRDAHSS